MGISEAIRSDNFFRDEDDELVPMTKAVCAGLEARGIYMTGQEVRRLARKVKLPTQLVDGRIVAKERDIEKFIAGVRRHFEGKTK